MAKVDGPKYKLLKKTKVYVPLWFSNVRLYQIEAVRDIPRHGVKAGETKADMFKDQIPSPKKVTAGSVKVLLLSKPKMKLSLSQIML